MTLFEVFSDGVPNKNTSICRFGQQQMQVMSSTMVRREAKESCPRILLETFSDDEMINDMIKNQK